MVRTQILLTEEQHRQLKRWARELGISLAEAVRRCVADRLSAEEAAMGPAERVREALAVVGRYADGRRQTQVARGHDKHLAKAYRR